MTNKNKEKVLAGFKALAADLQTGEMPDSLLEKGRALPFYRQAASEKDPERAFLAFYNAYGTLLGFRPGLLAMAEDLGAEPRLVRGILARVRRDESDADSPDALVPKPAAALLEALKLGFRKSFLK